VQAGRLDTTLAERIADTAGGIPRPPDEVLAAAALARLLTLADKATDPWEIPDGWRVGGPAWTKFRFKIADGHAEVQVRGLSETVIDDGTPVPARAEFDEAGLLLTYGGCVLRFAYAVDGATIWLGRDGHAWALTEEEAAPARRGGASGGDGTVR